MDSDKCLTLCINVSIKRRRKEHFKPSAIKKKHDHGSLDEALVSWLDILPFYRWIWVQMR